MFFKRLEVFGFKSFAEKTRVDFEAGVTAIVGPNGCGKTNILDSIKWVLGEQSVRSMRGAKMEDVIFHGADDIPPVGFAEVSLTISNQNNLLPLEYQEVTITRRIFRSGESEYLINKIPVRLRDISELLMGTGIGMPSYSLMEQGQVDQILSSKAEDRRTIFEEAAGITKYKSKKEEALRKLERTQENLQRIGDIIVEVKRQIKSMERQVNRARRYKEEFEKLKEHELSVSQYQYQNFKKEKRQLTDKVNSFIREESSLSSELDSVARSLENTREDLTSLEENIGRIQAKSFEVSASIKTGNDKIVLDEERIEELARRQEELAGQLENLEAKIAQSAELIKQAQEKVRAIEQEKQEKLALLAEKEENISNILAQVKAAQAEIAQDKTKEVEVLARQTQLKNELTKQQANLANFNARLRRLNIERERTQGELVQIEEKYKVISKESDNLNEQSKTLTRQVWDLKSNLNIKLEKKQKLGFHLEELLRNISSLYSKLNFLKEMSKRNEGFSNGVKSILSAKDSQEFKVEGPLDAVANLLKVSPEYQIAIEMALGEDAQAIVVENYQAAEQAGNYLKTKDSGRAKFICLDSLTPEKQNRIRLSQALTRAQEYVKVEPEYQKLLEYLLANTFIVESLEAGREILKQAREPGLKLVTLKGEILTPASVVSGSLPRHSDTGLLGRAERINRTQTELERIERQRQGLDDLIGSQQEELKELTALIQEKEPQLNKLKVEAANKENEKTNIESSRKRIEEELSVLNMEIEETTGEVAELEKEHQNLNQQIEQENKARLEIEQRIVKQQEFIADKNQEKQNTLVEITRLRTEGLSLDRETENANLRYKMLCESENEQNQTRESGQGQIEAISAKIEQFKQEIEQLKSEGEGLAKTQIAVEKQLTQASQKRQNLSGAIHQLEQRLRSSQKALDEVKERRNSLQIKGSELTYKQDSLKDRVQQSYQVDLEATLEDALEISPPEDSLLEEIKHLKTRLEGMGPVNLVAIEENDQLQQRYSFLISQQEDLVNAQESLRKAITQINRTAREKFSQTFKSIQESFKEYFRILFGGGDARLILIDENNVLESGIEIVVRPPGKKLQNISLLSGGERALTAIALLFAIFKIKPSPFCILDEVDAPLDEANIDRFTNLLREFIKTSQFIIITHNKKTINMADVMYGITMERSGVSKIVSVRFTDKEDSPQREVAPVEK